MSGGLAWGLFGAWTGAVYGCDVLVYVRKRRTTDISALEFCGSSLLGSFVGYSVISTIHDHLFITISSRPINFSVVGFILGALGVPAFLQTFGFIFAVIHHTRRISPLPFTFRIGEVFREFVFGFGGDRLRTYIAFGLFGAVTGLALSIFFPSLFPTPSSSSLLFSAGFPSLLDFKQLLPSF